MQWVDLISYISPQPNPKNFSRQVLTSYANETYHRLILSINPFYQVYDKLSQSVTILSCGMAIEGF